MSDLVKVFDDKVITIPESKVVECERCHKRHLACSDDFVVVYGNITVGQSGGILGDNFEVVNECAVLYRVDILCRGKCFMDAMKDCIGSA